MLRPLTLAPGKTLDTVLAAPALAVVVDNTTSAWLLLPDAGRYVPPGSVGMVIPLPGQTRAQAVWQAPVGQVQPDVAQLAGQSATLIYQEEAAPALPGTGWAASIVPTLVGRLQLSHNPGSPASVDVNVPLNTQQLICLWPDKLAQVSRIRYIDPSTQSVWADSGNLDTTLTGDFGGLSFAATAIPLTYGGAPGTITVEATWSNLGFNMEWLYIWASPLPASTFPPSVPQAGNIREIMGAPLNALAGNAPTGSGSSWGGLPVVPGPPQTTNILNGQTGFGQPTGAGTLLTIPAGRVWQGSIVVQGANGGADGLTAPYVSGANITNGIPANNTIAQVVLWGARATAASPVQNVTLAVASGGANGVLTLNINGAQACAASATGLLL